MSAVRTHMEHDQSGNSKTLINSDNIGRMQWQNATSLSSMSVVLEKSCSNAK
jgi:hypothetical protein